MEQNKNTIKIKMVLPKFYRNFILLFFLFSLLLSLGLFYYIFGRVKIIIFPSYQKVSTETSVAVDENIKDAKISDTKAIAGKLYSFEISDAYTIPATGKKVIYEDSFGKVTIVNNYSKNQVLMATTRLLAPNNVLLRIKERIVVPRGGKIDVEVYPDKPNEFTELGPTKLTIPGLSADLQSKIFAENKDVIKKGKKEKMFVTTDDIKNIDTVIVKALDARIFEEFKQKLTSEETLYSQLIQKEIIEKKLDAAAGDEKDVIHATARVRVVAVVFDEIRLINYLRKEIASTLSSGKKVKDLDPKSIVYTMEKYDLEKGTATIRVYIEGRAVIKSDNRIFEKEKLFGKGREGVIQYFKQFPEIEKIQVQFFPSWIPRVPRAEEKIDIIIE